MDHEHLVRRFNYHPADTPEKIDNHNTVRRDCLETALTFNGLLPEGREKSIAIKKLEEAMFWANAALARPKPEDG